MTEFTKTNFKCNICGNEENNLQIEAIEMLFGTKEMFKYIECSKCKCIQIKEIPDNLAQYYPSDYNSFEPVVKIKDNLLKSVLKRILAKDYLLEELNFFTKILYNSFGVGFVDKIKLTKVTQNSKILDIGSGNGHRLVGLARYGFKNITGIDPFIETDIFYDNNIKIYKKDIWEVDDTFDMIMLNHSFEHMVNPIEVLEKITKLLRSNGKVLIRIPVSNSYSWKKYKSNWVALDPPRHIYLHNEKTIKILAEKFGLKLTDVLYDSSEYQFIGSEQYVNGIPMFSKESYYKNKESSIFSDEQIIKFKEHAKKLNESSEGDAACFYLTKCS